MTQSNSKIPYSFITPVPSFFRAQGYFKSQNTMIFITWAFSQCYADSRYVTYNRQRILLQPFQFIFGRLMCCTQTRLTENEVRTQLNKFIKLGFLKKTTSQNQNLFSIYEWDFSSMAKLHPTFFPNQNHQPDTQNHQPTHQPTHQPKPQQNPQPNSSSHNNLSSILKNNPQPNPQLNHQLNHQPTHHILEVKNLQKFKDNHHHPNPSSSLNQPAAPRIDDDDFSSSKDINYQSFTHTFTHNNHQQTITLSKADYLACLEIKGSKEKLIEAIEYIQKSPARKVPITSWPNALLKWTIKPEFTDQLKRNKAMGDKLCADYGDSMGYRCQKYHDSQKNQDGILFYSTASAGNPPTYFISFSDPDFKNKCLSLIKEKKMQKPLKSNNLETNSGPN